MNQFIVDLGRALLELFEILKGDSSGIFQGSHEAAIFEAQGGQVGEAGRQHLTSVLETARAIQIRVDALNLAIARVNGVDPALAVRVRDVCSPILQQSRQYLQAAAETERVVVSLRQTDPTRFEGVILGEGGLGPEIGRSGPALVSNQLNRLAAQLAARGIEPGLIPSARHSLQSVTSTIRQLPRDAEAAVANLRDKVALMTSFLGIAARQALAAGRVALSAALTAMEQALIQIGSRLNVPFIIFTIPRSTIERMLDDLHNDLTLSGDRMT